MSLPDEEAEAGGVGDDIDGIPLGVRDSCLVTSSGDQLEEVPGGFCVDITVGESVQAVPVIPIVVVGGRLLIAVPSPVWHRSPSQRILPAGALIKPALAVVAGVIPGDPPSQASSGVEVKVWVAYASGQLETQIRAEEHEDVLEPAFADSDGQACLPYAASLIQLADDHFAFLTAESEIARPSRGPGVRMTDRRIAALEESVGDIKMALATLVEQTRPAVGSARPAPPKTQTEKLEPILKKTDISGLDKSVVASARAAGIPDEHLAQMAKLMKAKPRTIGDLPSAPVHAGPLSETEEEAQDEPEAGAPGSVEAGGQVERAVLELTKIAKSLVASKQDPKTDLESLLGFSSLGDKGEGSSVGSSRRNSAALAALRRSLRDSPAMIFETMERNMREDFGLREALPGEPQGQTTVRAWLQSRSRVQNYTNHVRWMWQLAAVWDCLIQDKVPEARARVALMMVAGEQSSIDSGNWLVSTVSLLEGPPPYQQFSHHQSPAAHELQHSALFDPRWFELFLWAAQGAGVIPRGPEKVVPAAPSIREQSGGSREAGQVPEAKTGRPRAKTMPGTA